MIAFSAEAEPARAFLLRHYNDLEIYVEDSSCQNMYVRLFNRMLEGHGKRIAHVFPLHGRKNVIDKCAADQEVRARRRLYIIDGDQDLLRQVPAPNLLHLYRLQVYCAENLLLSEYAIVTIGTECRIDETWHDVAIRLSIRAFIERSVRLLLPLFVLYAVIQELDLSIQTVDYPVQRLMISPNDATSLSSVRVRVRMLQLRRAICSEVDYTTYRAVRKSISRRLSRDPANHSSYISAKTYLLPLLHLQLTRVGLTDSQGKLKVRLAQHCELDIDPGLKSAVLQATD